jgi:hypothetical protein
VDQKPGTIQLQIETSSTCSAACVFCTYPQVAEVRAGKLMPMSLFKRIIDDASTIPQIDTLKLTGLNEPTLDRFLEERLRYCKEKMPHALTQIYTHGAHLIPKRHDALRAAGLDSIIFSLNAVRAEQHERIMGLKGKFALVCRNIDYAIANRGEKHVEVHAVCNGDTFPAQDVVDFLIRWGHADEGGYGLCVYEGNWTGDTRTVRGFSPNKCCFRAINQIYVMFDGRVSTCCFDPTGKQVFGDLSKQTIREVYNFDPYLQFRIDHNNDEADKYDICRNCTRI